MSVTFYILIFIACATFYDMFAVIYSENVKFIKDEANCHLLHIRPIKIQIIYMLTKKLKNAIDMIADNKYIAIAFQLYLPNFILKLPSLTSI